MKNTLPKKRIVFGLYKRKFVFFVLLFLMAFVSYKFVQNMRIGADSITQSSLLNSGGSRQVLNLEILENGSVLVNGAKSDIRLNPLADSDELRLPVIDNPPAYIDELVVYVKLPQAVAGKVTKQILAIKGVEASYSELLDDSTLRYRALGISQTATVSIVANIPKGVIERSIWFKLFSEPTASQFSFWVYLALALPVFTILFMMIFINYTTKLNKVEIPEKEVSSPPMAIPPALVGVLYHQKVTPREIAATLIDLAQRRDIFILDRDRGFAFGKGKFDQRLLGYEKMLLSKIFKNSISTTQSAVEESLQSQIYSKKVSLVSAGIYGIATRLGYFRQNPRKLHAKYWLFGSFAIAFAVAGFISSFFMDILPSFTALFWVGMMVSAIIIILMAGRIPFRTNIGRDALSNWLAFRKYLTNPEPIEYSPTVHQLFEAYLPYAVVLDCESAWARRFAKHNFSMPEWFITEKNGLGLEDFCLALFPIVSYVSRSLAALREPGFE